MERHFFTWPEETAHPATARCFQWNHGASNRVLDFHGNPQNAKVTILSDGNHHMALRDVAARFLEQYPGVQEVFYVTLPPRLVSQIVVHNDIQLGNLRLTIKPDVLLSPPTVLRKLAESGHVTQINPFVKNQGSVLLLPQGNPKNITGIKDLFRKDVKLFISNPVTEKVSHQGYRATLLNTAKAQSLNYKALQTAIDENEGNILYGEQIHHREAPLAITQKQCDVAIVYYHLALRFKRIFPENLEFLPLGGSIDQPEPDENNIVSEVHMGLSATAGEWGKKIWDYLQSDFVAGIYEYHGLLSLTKKIPHKRD